MRIKAMLGAALLTGSHLLAQDAQDPDGWRAAKWGMKEEAVLGAFPEAIRLDKAHEFSEGRRGTIAIPNYEIRSTKYNVLFVFAGAALAVVQITPVDLLKPGSLHGADFGALENVLIEKYGKPLSSKDERTRTRMWRFPRTVITLQYMPSMEYLSLNYEPPSKEADKL